VENPGCLSTEILKVGGVILGEVGVVADGERLKEGNLEGGLGPGFVVLTSSLVRGITRREGD